jgi:hypothetical protein
MAGKVPSLFKQFSTRRKANGQLRDSKVPPFLSSILSIPSILSYLRFDFPDYISEYDGVRGPNLGGSSA